MNLTLNMAEKSAVMILGVWLPLCSAAQMSVSAEERGDVKVIPVTPVNMPADAAKSTDTTAPQAAQLCKQQPVDQDVETPRTTDKCWRFALGLNARFDDIGGPASRTRPRLALGLSYGRWSLGVADPEAWLGNSSLRRSSSLAYSVVDQKKLSARVSLSVYNLSSGEGVESFDRGRYSLRGRVAVDYRLSPAVSFGGNIARDLLNRGGGTSMSLGAVRNMAWSESTVWALSTDATLGTSAYWQGGKSPAPGQPGISAGLGSVGASLGVRHKISAQWVTFAQAGMSVPVGVTRDAGQTRTSYSARLGVIWFGVF